MLDTTQRPSAASGDLLGHQSKCDQCGNPFEPRSKSGGKSQRFCSPECQALRALYQDPQGYQTLIIDTLDSLEPMLLDAVCAKNGWKNIESPSYGKGFVIADQEWQRFIRAISLLRDKGMIVVMVAHSTIERFDDPRAPSYTAYWPKLHKRARHLILDACDVVGFLAEELRVATDDSGFRERTRATTSNQRFLFVEGTPAYVAKNRFGMPPKIAMPIDFDVKELSKYWQKQEVL